VECIKGDHLIVESMVDNLRRNNCMWFTVKVYKNGIEFTDACNHSPKCLNIGSKVYGYKIELMFDVMEIDFECNE
jgi:Zinc-binding loop region of homing endonuclease